jgi:hypothetical protein
MGSEGLVRDRGVGGLNPLSPTIFSLALSIVYAATAASAFSVHFVVPRGLQVIHSAGARGFDDGQVRKYFGIVFPAKTSQDAFQLAVPHLLLEAAMAAQIR